jgi:hypothetical protein
MDIETSYAKRARGRFRIYACGKNASTSAAPRWRSRSIANSRRVEFRAGFESDGNEVYIGIICGIAAVLLFYLDPIK